MHPDAAPTCTPRSPAGAPPVDRLRLPEILPAAGSVAWGCCRLTPLGQGAIALEARSLDLAGMVVQTGRCTPVAAIGSLPSDVAWLVLPLEGRESLRIRGCAVGERGVVVLGGGAEYELANPRASSWGLVALPAEAAQSLLWQPQALPLRRRGAGGVVPAAPVAWQRAAALFADLAEVVAESPEVFALETARRALRDAVLDACHDLLGGGDARPRGASPACRRLVRAADEAVAAEPARGADSAALAATLGVSEVRLRQAFLRVLGVSAARYLVRRRLVAARAALRAPGRTESLAAIALRHGFPGTAPFRRVYRALYGTAPPEACEAGGTAGLRQT